MAIKSGPLFIAGWLVAVVLVLIALGGLVLARDIWVSHQTSALEQQEQQGPIVIVVPLIHSDTKRTLSCRAKCADISRARSTRRFPAT